MGWIDFSKPPEAFQGISEQERNEMHGTLQYKRENEVARRGPAMLISDLWWWLDGLEISLSSWMDLEWVGRHARVDWVSDT